MNRDNTIFELIEKEHQRQLKGIELITRLSSWLSTEYANSSEQSMPTYSPTLVPRLMQQFCWQC